MPQDGVERVDELPARCDESHAPASVPVALAFDASPRDPFPQARADSAQGEPDAEPPRTAIQEREVEPVKVVVLDDVRVGGLYSCHQPPNQLGFVLGVRPLGFDQVDRA